MSSITVAGNQVGRVGFGLMQLTAFNPPSQEQAFAAMKAAAEAGANIWSTATFYGVPPDGTANLKLIRAFFDKYPEWEDKITIVVKGGFDYAKFQIHTELDDLRAELIEAKKILGSKAIDVYLYGRLPDRPIEETFEKLVTLQKEGHFKAIGGSEMNVESLKRASKITPIAIVELEVSLFSYEPAIRDVVAWSAETGTPLFAYSPLGRGMLTRKWQSSDDIPENDMKRKFPRFQGEAFYENLKLVDKLDEIAQKKGVKTSQLALAWITGLSDFTIPIPGSSQADRVRENTAAQEITLAPEEKQAIDDFLAKFEPAGTRYPAQLMGLTLR